MPTQSIQTMIDSWGKKVSQIRLMSLKSAVQLTPSSKVIPEVSEGPCASILKSTNPRHKASPIICLPKNTTPNTHSFLSTIPTFHCSSPPTSSMVTPRIHFIRLTNSTSFLTKHSSTSRPVRENRVFPYPQNGLAAVVSVLENFPASLRFMAFCYLTY